MWGALEYARREKLGPDAVVVTLVPDHGLRYLSKVYSEQWLRENGLLESEYELAAHELLDQKRNLLQMVSVGIGASTWYDGSTYVSRNDMALITWGAPPLQPGIYFYGNYEVQVPFGDGYRCVGGNVFRLLDPSFADAQGNVYQPLDFNTPPFDSGLGMITPGSTWSFQWWYRDPAAGGAGFNLSSGIRVTFCD